MIDSSHLPQHPQEVETEDEKLKRLNQEAELHKAAAPQTGNVIGPDSTGVGGGGLQQVHNGGSLPPTAVPVTDQLQTAQVYHPNDEANATVQRERDNTGAKKTDI